MHRGSGFLRVVGEHGRRAIFAFVGAVKSSILRWAAVMPAIPFPMMATCLIFIGDPRPLYSAPGRYRRKARPAQAARPNVVMQCLVCPPHLPPAGATVGAYSSAGARSLIRVQLVSAFAMLPGMSFTQFLRISGFRLK